MEITVEYLYENKNQGTQCAKIEIQEDDIIGLIRILNGDQVSRIFHIETEEQAEQSKEIEDLKSVQLDLESRIEELECENKSLEEEVDRLEEIKYELEK